MINICINENLENIIDFVEGLLGSIHVLRSNWTHQSFLPLDSFESLDVNFICEGLPILFEVRNYISESYTHVVSFFVGIISNFQVQFWMKQSIPSFVDLGRRDAKRGK